MKVAFVLAGDSTPIGTKELEAIPELDDEVELNGDMYRVEDRPRDVSSDEPTVWVRKVA